MSWSRSTLNATFIVPLMKLRLVFWCVLVLLAQHSLGQTETCGSAQLLQSVDVEAYYGKLHALMNGQSAPQTRKQTATIVVPTVFHIVYNTPAQNIPDSLIYEQLQIINDDFQRKNADTVNTPAAFQSIAGAMDIAFCLAQQTPSGAPTTGIVRVPTNVTSFPSPTSYAVPDPVKHSSSGGSDAWDTDQYLNIWVCNLTGSTAYSAPPGNFMPDDEGVVCKYQHVGRTHVYPYGEGRSIVHEIGHYLCLKHIWGDDGGACTGTDYIGDTPNQGNYSTNCPTFPLTDACSPTSPGVMYMNYMDYSEDGCRNMFTQGQVAYMLSCLTQLRPGLLSAQGCVPVVGVEEAAPVSVSIGAGGDAISIRCDQKAIVGVRIIDVQGRRMVELNQLYTQTVVLPSDLLSHTVYVVEVRMENGEVWRQKVVW